MQGEFCRLTLQHRYDNSIYFSMKILVTGGAGFIGSHVVDAYVALGHEVVVVDNLSTGNRANIHSKTKFYEVDVTSEKIERIFQEERPQVINHLAAQIDVRRSVSEPVWDANVNIIGSIQLMELSRKYGIKKFLFSSSGGAIYGAEGPYPTDENGPTEGQFAQPQSPYGIAKLTVEKYLQFYSWTYKIPFVALRYANVYGPRQNALGEAGVVAIFTTRLLRGEAPVINGDGKQTRDYVYVDDVVHCNVEALKPDVRGIFNVGTGVETDVTAIATRLIQLTKNSNVKPHFGPAKDGEARRSCLKPGALQKMPITPLAEGLKRTIDWYESTQN